MWLLDVFRYGYKGGCKWWTRGSPAISAGGYSANQHYPVLSQYYTNYC